MSVRNTLNIQSLTELKEQGRSWGNRSYSKYVQLEEKRPKMVEVQWSIETENEQLISFSENQS